MVSSSRSHVCGSPYCQLRCWPWGVMSVVVCPAYLSSRPVVTQLVTRSDGSGSLAAAAAVPETSACKEVSRASASCRPWWKMVSMMSGCRLMFIVSATFWHANGTLWIGFHVAQTTLRHGSEKTSRCLLRSAFRTSAPVPHLTIGKSHLVSSHRAFPFKRLASFMHLGA